MSQAKTPKKGVNKLTLASPIKVQAGDFVGLYYPKAGSVSFKKNSGAWDLGNLKGSVLFTSSGAKATAFSGSSNRTYSVKAEGVVKKQPQQQPDLTKKPDTTFSCDKKKKCGEMASCKEAKYHLQQCGNKRLDRNKDGIPCESLCKK
jgi:hypothetical protein